MKKIIAMFAVIVMVATFFVSCGDDMDMYIENPKISYVDYSEQYNYMRYYGDGQVFKIESCVYVTNMNTYEVRVEGELTNRIVSLEKVEFFKNKPVF